MRRRAALLLLVLPACNGDPGPPTLPSGPPPSSPSVQVTLAFSDSPLEGEAILYPSASAEPWRYAVDLDGDGIVDDEGVLADTVRLGYRFESPEIHQVRVEFTFDGFQRVHELPVIVNDPEAIRTLATRLLTVPDPGSVLAFEGITVDHAGATVYAVSYWHRILFSLNPSDLTDRFAPLDLSYRSPEGLSIVPSDTLLLIASKVTAFTAVAIPDPVERYTLGMAGEFYIRALDDTLALTTTRGRDEVNVIDIRTGHSIRSASVDGAGHFAVSTAGDAVAVLQQWQPPSLHLFRLPDLVSLGEVPLPELEGADVVAFDPGGDRVYVLGGRSRGSHFILVDVGEMEVLTSLPLGGFACWIYCVANPAATLMSGRFVAMEQGSGVYFIDTEIDLPRFHTQAGFSVAASPTDDVFFTLRSDGLLSKIAIVP